MAAQIMERPGTRDVFELVMFVDGRAVPYVPYTTTCTSCCGSAEPAAAPHSCCH